MARTELPWLLWGRYVRPFSLASAIGSAAVAALICTSSTVWGDSRDVWSILIASVAALATVLLTVGFWANRSVPMQWGLALVAAVFAARGTYIGLQGSWLTALLSWSWVVGAGGAHLLEATSADVRGRDE